MAGQLQRVLNYFTREIQDAYIRENFQRLREYFRNDPVVQSQFTFATYDISDKSPSPAYPFTQDVPHALKFTPTDVILLSVTNDDAASVTFNYDDFTDTTLNITVSAACTVRAFVGRYGA